MAAAFAAVRRFGNLLIPRLTASSNLGLNLRPMSAFAEEEASKASPEEAPGHSYESLRVTAAQKHVLHVQLNRPEKRNAMNKAFWREMVVCFNKIAEDSDCRVVVISGAGKMFSSGVDLITACDIRYSTRDSFFQVKEVDVGLAADVGTLQRLPKVIGNQSLVNELAYTARKMMADEALESGLVSRLFPDKESMLDAAFTLAAEISSKSPVAVQSTKINLIYSRNHSVMESLNYMKSWNMSMLQTKDIMKSVQAAIEKKDLKTVSFSKL
nr:PREDICTED: delta(3,5)-Delta(2,4)-dienoyl-CoA isomerase, mitochondrial isoform X2 [Bos mutus]